MQKQQWKVLQRNRKLLERSVITESVNLITGQRRWTATIDGWQNWRLLVVGEFESSPNTVKVVIEKARSILERIDAGDESVFDQSNNAW